MANLYIVPVNRIASRAITAILTILVFGAATLVAQQAPTVLAPNGGERYEMTDPVVIRWSAPDARAVRVEFSPNGGRIWIVVDTAVDASLGTLSFIPGYPTLYGRIRVTDVDRPALLDVSDGNFVVLEAPSIAIYSPAEQDQVIRGSTHAITWLAGRIARVHIEYSPNGGDPGSWQRIASFVDARRGFFEWAVPTTLTARAKIRILDADGPTIGETGIFQIVDPITPQPFVRVIVPNGGEVYTIGDDVTISWSASGSTANIAIDLSSDGGVTWTRIITRPTGAPINSIVWSSSAVTVPVAGRSFRVRVTTERGSDISDANFEMRRPINPTITVTYPNGGEIFATDSTIDVTWLASDITGDVDIEYSLDAGATWRAIGTAAAGLGTIRWEIPDTVSARALVRVVGGPITDVSDALFSIVEPEDDLFIEVLSPNLATDEWAEASFATITWRSRGIANVDIALSTDGGASWGWTITQSYPAATGRYDYRVPHLADTVMTSLLVRVAMTGGGVPFDYSDATFRYRPTIAGIDERGDRMTLGIAPNPAHSSARVTWRLAARELRLFDATGALVRTAQIEREQRSVDLDVDGLGAGVYVMEVRGEDGVERARLIVR